LLIAITLTDPLIIEISQSIGVSRMAFSYIWLVEGCLTDASRAPEVTRDANSIFQRVESALDFPPPAFRATMSTFPQFSSFRYAFIRVSSHCRLGTCRKLRLRQKELPSDEPLHFSADLRKII